MSEGLTEFVHFSLERTASEEHLNSVRADCCFNARVFKTYFVQLKFKEDGGRITQRHIHYNGAYSKKTIATVGVEIIFD